MLSSISGLSPVSSNHSSLPQAELEHLLAAYPATLTVAEVAAVLRVHERSMQRWAREGCVVSVRVGWSYRFLRDDVLKLLSDARIYATIAPITQHRSSA